MAESVLHCEACRVTYEVRGFDADKVYKCKRCGGPLSSPGESASASPHATAESRLPLEQDPLIGQTIAGCRIIRKLGEGGMGAVYQAVEISLERAVALKILPKHLLDRNQQYVDRFIREAKSAAQLDHSNTVTVYGAGEETGSDSAGISGPSAGLYFIKMQYVDGGSLEDLLKLRKRLPPKRAALIARDAAQGLGAAHKRHLVHRDVKPGNIMISNEGQVLVADFGLAKNVGGLTGLTQTGQIMGTPLYMSPEQCAGKPADGRSDIYSLGATLYQCLTGKPPFLGESTLSLLRHHCDTPVTPLTDHDAMLPESLCRIVEKMLAKAVEERYQTCDEVIADLDAFLAEAASSETPTVHTIAPVEPAAASQPPPAHRPSTVRVMLQKMGPMRATLALIPVIVVLCIAGWQMWGRRPETGDERQGNRGQRSEDRGQARREKPEIKGQGPSGLRKGRADGVATGGKEEKRTADHTDDADKGPLHLRPSVKSAVEAPRYELWKRLGPTVPVPGPDGNVQQLPAGAARSVEYSPDGKYMALAHSFGVDLYNTRSWEIVRRFDGHEHCVYSIAFSRNGKELATGSRDHVLRIWDVESGRELRALDPRANDTFSLAFNLDGSRLAVAQLSVVAVLESGTGQELGYLKGHDGVVRSVAVSPDGRHLLSGGDDGTVRLWDLEQGVELGCLRGHDRPVYSVAFSADGHRVASGSHDGTVRVWDVEGEPRERRVTKCVGAVYAVAFSPDGGQLAVGAAADVVQVWDVVTGEHIGNLDLGNDKRRLACVQMCFSPDGRELACASPKLGLSIWDTATWQQLRPLGRQSRGDVMSVAFSQGGELLVSGYYLGDVCIWETGTGRQLRTLEAPGEGGYCVYAAAFSPDSRLVASNVGAYAIRISDAESGVELHRLERAGQGSVRALAFSPDGRCLASGSIANTICLWDPQTGTELGRLEGHSKGVRSLAFSPDGGRLASGSDDGTVRVWDRERGVELLQVKGHRVALSPDGRRLASTQSDYTIRVWGAETGNELRCLAPAGNEALCSVAFNPGGRYLASGHFWGTIRIWDVDEGKCVYSLKEHRAGVGVAFSPDGGLLASGSVDDTICLWRRAEELTAKAAKGAEEEGIPGAKRKKPKPAAPSAPSASSAVKTPRYELWKRLGPTVPVPDADGKIEQLPGGVPQDAEYSPDGRYVAVAHSFGVDLYDTGKWQILRRFDGHEGTVNDVAFSPDGETLATGSDDSMVRIWHVTSGRELLSLEGHYRQVLCVAFSPDGERLASGTRFGKIRIWDPKKGAELRVLKGHEGSICSIAFSVDGRRLASISGDSTVRIWNVSTGDELRVLEGHPRMRHGAIAFSPDGRYLASGAIDDHIIRIWDAETGSAVRSMEQRYGGSCLAFSRDGQRLISGAASGGIRLWRVPSGNELPAVRAHTACVKAISLSPDGRHMVSCSDKGVVRLADADTGGELRAAHDYAPAVLGIAFSPDGERLALGCTDTKLRVWRVDTGRAVWSSERTYGSSLRVAFSPDGRRLASGDGGGMVRLWQVGAKAQPHGLKGHTEYVHAVAFSPDGLRLASGSRDRTARIWDVEKRRELHVLKGHPGDVRSVAFGPDGRQLATCGPPDTTVRLWNAGTGELARRLEGHSKYVSCVAFSPDGRLLASGADDRTVRLWDPKTGEALSVLKLSRYQAQLVAFSSDSRYIAVGFRYYGEVELWDADSGSRIDVLKGHRDAVNSLSFSRDGVLASGSKDGSICLWRQGRGQRSAVRDQRSDKATPAAEPRSPKAETKLPPSFENAFMIPDSDRDQHRNAVVTRNGGKVDSETGWPYEIWLKEPRMEFVLVPAGELMAGGQESERREQPDGPSARRPGVTQRLYMGKYEVTVGVFRRFVQETGFLTKAERTSSALVCHGARHWGHRSDASWKNPYFDQGATHPVVCVSWNGAQQFLRWLNQQLSLSHKEAGDSPKGLPDEVSCRLTLPATGLREFACRAGSDSRFFWGDDETDTGRFANVHDRAMRNALPEWNQSWSLPSFDADDGVVFTAPVGRFSPNAFGLYDMIGNVSEWCTDRADDTAQNIRGGAWNHGPRYARCANSDRQPARHCSSCLGFRVSLKATMPSSEGSARSPLSREAEAPPIGPLIADAGKEATEGKSQRAERRGQKADAEAAPRPPKGPAVPSSRYQLWKRLGPTVPVPGPDGKMQQLPGGVPQDAEYSPNGRYVAVAHSFGVDLYDTQKWQVLRRFDGHEGTVNDVAFSPDGQTLATGSDDHTIRVWHVISGRELLCLKADSQNVVCVAFSPDGGRLASGEGRGAIRLWDAKTGRKLRVLKGHKAPVWSAAFSPDDRRLASISQDSTVRIWNVSSGEELRTLQVQRAQCGASIAFSPDGRYVASGVREDHTIRLWNAQTYAEVRSFEHGYGGLSLAFSRDGKRLISGASAGSIRLWQISNGNELRTLKTPDARVTGVSLSPDDHHLVSCGDREVRLWDADTGRELRTIRDYASPVSCVAFDQDGDQLALGCRSTTLQIWDVTSGQTVWSVKGGYASVFCVALSPDGRYLASNRENGIVSLWQVGTKTQPRGLKGHADSVYSVAFCPDGRLLASGSKDGTARIWDVEGRRELHVLKGYPGAVGSLAFSPDGRRLATRGTSDGTLGLWDVATGELVRRLEGHDKNPNCVAFSPDGRLLASCATDRTARVWDAKTGNELHVLELSRYQAHSIAFSSDSRHIAVGFLYYGGVEVWDADKGSKIDVLEGHGDQVNSLSFSRGGVLASGSKDGSVCLWREARGQRSDGEKMTGDRRPETEDRSSEIRGQESEVRPGGQTQPPPPAKPAQSEIRIPQSAIDKIRSYFPTPAMKEAIRRLIAERRKPFKDARVITVRQDGKGDFTSIQAAVDAAKPGDEVRIADDGTYRESVNVDKPDLLLIVAPNRRPSIDAEDEREVCISVTSGAPGSIVVGLRCRNAANCAIRCAPADCMLALNECTRSSSRGIEARGGARMIVGNICAGNRHFGIEADGPKNALIAFNAALGGERGLYSGPKPETRQWAVVASNLFMANEHNAFLNTGNALLMQNVLVRNGSSTTIRLWNPGRVLFLGNAFALNPKRDIEAVKGSEEVGDLVFGSNWNLFGRRLDCVEWKLRSDRGKFKEWQQQLGNDLNSIQGDPKFVDPANYDFRLRPDSPCRGAGPNGTDIGIQWDADADYFYKLLTTPVEDLVKEAERAIGERTEAGGRKSAVRDQRSDGAAGPRAPEAEAKLPPGFDNAFMIPDSDRDQHRNAVVTRNGSKFDPTTGYPYEIWLNLPAAPTTTQAGEPRMEFVLVPAGEFMMGSSEEEVEKLCQDYKDHPDVREFLMLKPQHSVRITRPLYLGKYEVTQGQWEQVMGNAPWRGKERVRENARHAAGYLSWNECQMFVERINQERGMSACRLPTEAEWEYACRAGSTGAYCFGDASLDRLKEFAWFRDTAFAVGEYYAHAVGMKRPNAWGFYDMHGNVREWCQDWYADYEAHPQTDPTGPATGTRRVYRDAGPNLAAVWCRCARRLPRPPDFRYDSLGVRVAMTIRRHAEPLAPETDPRTQAAIPGFMAEDGEGKWVIWKRLGPTVPVPGPDGKMQQLPGGVPQDAEYSPDGRHVAIAHSFGVDLYDAEKWQVLRRFDGHEATVNDVAFSPDGQTLATCSEDQTIRLWRVSSGQELLCLRDGSQVECLAYSPDGKYLASEGTSGSIRIWDLAKGAELRELKGHKGLVWSVAFSPDGQRIASIAMDSTARIWNANTGEELRTLQVQRAQCAASIAFSPDCRYFASGAPLDHVIRLWDAQTYAEVRSLKLGYGGWSLAFSRDGRHLASGNAGGTIRLWQVSNGDELRTLKTLGGHVRGVSLSPDDRHLVSCSDDGTLRLWDVDAGKELRALKGYGAAVSSIAFSAEGDQLASDYGGSILQIWDAISGETVWSEKRPYDGVLCVAISPDGRYLASGMGSGVVWLWNVEAEPPPLRLEGHAEHVCAVAFSPDGRLLASGSQDRTARIWGVENRRELHVLKGYPGSVGSVAFSPDGRHLATRGTSDATVGLWNVATGELLRRLEGHGKNVDCVAFSPDGRLLASGASDRTVRVWDAKTGDGLRVLKLSRYQADSVAFGSDSRHLAVGFHYYGEVELWDADNGTRTDVLKGHRDGVKSLSFSRDGVLASGSKDGSICLWRRGKGERPRTAVHRPQTSIERGKEEGTADHADDADKGPLHPRPSAKSAVPQIPSEEIEKIAAKIKTYFPTPAMKEAIRRLIAERRKPFRNARVITVRQDGKGDFTSIQAAVDAAKAGDEVRIEDDGTYREHVTLSKPDLLLSAVPGRPPLVDAQGARYPCVFVPAAARGGLVVGLRCHNSGSYCIRLDAPECLAALNECAGAPSGGLGCCADGFLVVGNTCIPKLPAAIHLSETPRGFIALNALVALGKGIYNPNRNAPEGTAVLAQNIFLQIRDSGFGGRATGAVSHNVFIDHRNGVVVDRAGTTYIQGNVFGGNPQNRDIVVRGDRVAAAYPTVFSNYNVLPSTPDCVTWTLASGSGKFKEWQQKLGNDRNSIQGDPKFVDPANYDFRLRPDSPCRGAGPNGTDIGIQWDADADYFYKLLTTPIERLVEEAREQRSGVRSQRSDQEPETRGRRPETGEPQRGKAASAAQEQAAAQLIDELRGSAEAKRWSEAAQALREIEREHSETAAYAAAKGEIATLAEKLSDQWVLWKRVGPTVPVPGPGGKIQPLPAGALKQVKFSPNGKYLGVAHAFGVDLCDAKTYRVLRRFDDHECAVRSFDFCRDSARLVTGLGDRTICIWDVSTGKRLTLIGRGATRHVVANCVAFSPDGASVASGMYYKNIHIWDAQTGRRLRTLEGHTGGITGVCFGPDGRELVSGSADKTVRIWDVRTGKVLHLLKGHEGAVKDVALSPDGTQIASAGYHDGTIRLWSTRTGRQLRAPKQSDHNLSVAFSPDGRRLVSAASHTVRLWDSQTGEVVRAFEGCREDAISAAFSPEGDRVAAASRDGTVRIWDANTGQLSYALPYGSWLWTMELGRDHRWVAAGGDETVIRVWDPHTGRQTRMLEGHRAVVTSLSLSPDGAHLASSGWGHGIRLWDVATGAQLRVFEGHTSNVGAVCFAPDGRTLASGSGDGTIRLWQVDTGSTLKVLTGHNRSVESVSFSPDGQYLASGSRDETVRLWDIREGTAVATLKEHTGFVTSVLFSPDGQHLVSHAGEAMCVWRVPTWEEARAVTVRSAEMKNALAYHSDGSWLACTRDRHIDIWDTTDWSRLCSLTGHRAMVTSLVLARDGSVLASASHDGSICLWRRFGDIDTGRKHRR